MEKHYLRTEAPTWNVAYAVYALLSHGVIRVFAVPVQEIRISAIELNDEIINDLTPDRYIAVNNPSGEQFREIENFSNFLGLHDSNDIHELVDVFWPEARRKIYSLNSNHVYRQSYRNVFPALLPGKAGELPRQAQVAPSPQGWEAKIDRAWLPIEQLVPKPDRSEEPVISLTDPPAGEAVAGNPPVMWPVFTEEATSSLRDTR